MQFSDTAHPHVPGVPDIEHLRSPAALQTARLAAQSQLVVAHFEHRALLPWPEHLCPAGFSALAAPPGWQRGQRVEHKFQSFRHDRMTGSFHPGHRAKWTAHELCHALVGFAYQPGKSRFFHALAAWLAELLPVALYYFFDEAGLRRCPAHTGGGPLFGRYCPACEAAAEKGARPLQTEDERWTKRGLAYVDAELAAWTRARRTGLARGHRHATLDLCSDAVAYAAAHALRLDSEPFERFAASFFDPGQGLHNDLDALEQRMRAVMDGIVHGAPVPAWTATRWDWLAQDVGYRLLLVRCQTEGEAAAELDRLVETLAGQRDPHGLQQAETCYRALAEQWVLPEADEVFALGCPLPSGAGSSLEQLRAGLESACPNTVGGLADVTATVRKFAAADIPERAPLGRRFARWLDQTRPGATADVAKYEAALSHAQPPDPVTAGLDPVDPRRQASRLAGGVELLCLEHDVVDTLDARAARRDTPTWLGIRSTPERQVQIVEVDPALASRLQQDVVPPDADDAALQQLAELGFLVPVRYEA